MDIGGFLTIPHVFYECSKVPEIEIQLGDYRYIIEAKNLVSEQEEGSCYIDKLTTMGTENEEWVLGTPFLKSYYQVYEMQRSQLGLSGGQKIS